MFVSVALRIRSMITDDETSMHIIWLDTLKVFLRHPK